jgi:flavin reductase (DIM6/NTAB) family NADH-FMN oxidoreductase RutF
LLLVNVGCGEVLGGSLCSLIVPNSCLLFNMCCANADCCLGKSSNIKDFTFFMIHVLHVSHPAALEGSTRYARPIVDNFFCRSYDN